MSNVTLLAIDLAKNIFQLYGSDVQGKTVFEKRIRRDKLLSFMANINKCKIYMEGCGSANYWGREFIKLGHQVKLINPKYVKPFVKRNKNDRNDSYAIASAARDPKMFFGEVKTEFQQDIQSTHRIRSMFISRRTVLANQTRGILAEYGIIVPKGISHISKHLPRILGDNETNLSSLMLSNLQELYESFIDLNNKLKKYEDIIDRLYEADERCKRLEGIPGIGRLGATILAAVLGNGSGFKNGRHFAAFLGLVPRESSSGEKEKMLGISKGGDTYVRTLLIHGARSVVLYANRKTDNLSMWLNKIKAQSGANVAAVAMANKMARIAWAIIRTNEEYQKGYKPKYNTIKAMGSLATVL